MIRSRFRFFSSLFPKGRIFVNLVVYADESGHHDGSGNLPGSANPVICGLAGKARQWEDFCRDWARILNAYSVPYFHFYDWAFAAAVARGVRKPSKSKENVYDGLSHARLEKLLTAVCKLIGSANFIDVGVCLPLKTQKPPENPNAELARLFFETLVSDVRSGHPNWDGGMTIIYDEPDRSWRNIINDAFYAAKTRWPHLKELVFGNKADHPGLQAADTVAFRFRQLFGQYEGGGLFCPVNSNDRYLLKSMFSQFDKYGFDGRPMFPKLRPKPSK